MNAKKIVEDWINNGKHYDDGVSLFGMLSNNKARLNFFRGDPHFKDRPATLAYELMKLAGISKFKATKSIAAHKAKTVKPVAFRESHSDQLIDIMNAERKPVKPKPPVINAENPYPDVVHDAINLYSSLYKERAKLFNQRSTLGWTNSASLVAQRKQLSDEIIELSGKMELLFIVRKEYEEKGILPEVNIAASLMAATDEELPNSIDELKKLKKNLQTNIAKDRNRLEYQSPNAKAVKTPTPEGPKRVKLEERIKARLDTIEKINRKIALLDAAEI